MEDDSATGAGRRARRRVQSPTICTTSPSVDILKEKMASLAKMIKVKTTEELVAGLQGSGATTDVVPTQPQSPVVQCLTQAPPLLRKQSLSPKEQQTTKPLSSQPALVPQTLIPPTLAQPCTLPVETDTVSTVIHSASDDDKSTDGTIQHILAQLPPLEDCTIGWEDTKSPPSVHRPLLGLHVGSHNIDGVTGNLDDNDPPNFCEWHEMVTRVSYHGQLLHILPYVVIN